MEFDKAELESRVFEGFADTSRRRYIYLCNMQTGISRWSKNAINDFDLPGEYMKDAGKIWAEQIHPEDREMYEEDIAAVFSGKKDRHEMEYRAKTKTGEYVLCTCRGRVIKGKDGAADLFLGTIENHSIRNYIDPATNLYNVYSYWNYLYELKRVQRAAIMLFVGVINFSEVNSTYGYSFGDRVLHEFSVRMGAVVRNKAVLFRLDGVQFVCCFSDGNLDEARKVYKEIQYEARNNIYVDGIRMSVSTSGGVVCFDQNYDEQTLQVSSKYVLSTSKHKYHGELVCYDNISLEGNLKNLYLMNEIRNSVFNNFEGFYLCYQPVIDARNESLVGAEALLRWKNDEFGEVPPGMFLPWLENDPCFWELGNWIVQRALEEIKPLLELYPDFQLNINLAYPQMMHSTFCEDVERIVKESGFPPQNICFELTERCHQLEKEALNRIINFLKDLGIMIAIDDFGIGFSSLNLLRELPINIVKIDRDFTKDIEENSANQAIVEGVTICAEKMHVHVCMEGVETKEMIEFARRYAIHSFQGYYYSKPICFEEFQGKYVS